MTIYGESIEIHSKDRHAGHAYIWAIRLIDDQADRQADRHADRQADTDRQKDRQASMQVGMQIGRWTYR